METEAVQATAANIDLGSGDALETSLELMELEHVQATAAHVGGETCAKISIFPVARATLLCCTLFRGRTFGTP